MNYDTYKSEFGTLFIKEDGTALTYVGLSEKETADAIHFESALIKKTKEQLDEYLLGKRKIFDLPLNPRGTEFEKKVWKALCEIPYGETKCYQQIAEHINCPKGCRAVGGANNKNPIVIIVPCHRVIGKSGSLVGYALGLDMKQQLLDLEKQIISSDETDKMQ